MVLALDGGEWPCRAPATFYPGINSGTHLPGGCLVAASQHVWTFWIREIFISPGGIQTPDHLTQAVYRLRAKSTIDTTPNHPFRGPCNGGASCSCTQRTLTAINLSQLRQPVWCKEYWKSALRFMKVNDKCHRT